MGMPDHMRVPSVPIVTQDDTGILCLLERQNVASSGNLFSAPQNPQLLLWDHFYFEGEINVDSTVNLFEQREVVTFAYLGCFVCEVQF